MPAMHYTVRWPDATVSTCYSPSLVIQDFFEPGQDYPLDEFLRRVREATHIASERVRAKFGFACSMATDQLAITEEKAARFAAQPGATVQMVSFDTAPA